MKHKIDKSLSPEEQDRIRKQRVMESQMRSYASRKAKHAKLLEEQPAKNFENNPDFRKIINAIKEERK